MGDTLRGSPAIQAIKKKLPDALWDTPIPNNDRKIQIPSNGTHMDIILSTDEKKEANFFLEKHGTRSKEFIYLNIGCLSHISNGLLISLLLFLIIF